MSAATASDEDPFEGALCREIGIELFYPTLEEQPWREAKQVCGKCRVIDACDDLISGIEIHAGSDSHREGMWAGLTTVERERRDKELPPGDAARQAARRLWRRRLHERQRQRSWWR